MPRGLRVSIVKSRTDQEGAVILSPFPVAALPEWLAAPVTQACHYVAYPHTTADSTSADQPLRSPLLAQGCLDLVAPHGSAY